MDVSQLNNDYQKILEDLQQKEIQISIDNAYRFWMKLNKRVSFPYPEMEKLENPRYYMSDEEFKEIHELDKERSKIIKESEKNPDISDFHIFSLKYFDEKEQFFRIPVVDLARNFFLCYKACIDKVRQGLSDVEETTLLTVYEIILGDFKKDLERGYRLDAEMLTASAEDLYVWHGVDYYFDDYKDKAVKAHNMITKLKENDANAVDAKNIVDRESFSKQLFIDLLEKSDNSVIVKKALAAYAETQSEEALLRQLNNVLASTKEQNKNDRLNVFDFVGFGRVDD